MPIPILRMDITDCPLVEVPYTGRPIPGLVTQLRSAVQVEVTIQLPSPKPVLLRPTLEEWFTDQIVPLLDRADLDRLLAVCLARKLNPPA